MSTVKRLKYAKRQERVCVLVYSSKSVGYGWFARTPIEAGEWVWRLTFSNRETKIYSFDEITSAEMVEFVFQFDDDQWEYIPKGGMLNGSFKSYYGRPQPLSKSLV